MKRRSFLQVLSGLLAAGYVRPANPAVAEPLKSYAQTIRIDQLRNISDRTVEGFFEPLKDARVDVEAVRATARANLESWFQARVDEHMFEELTRAH